MYSNSFKYYISLIFSIVFFNVTAVMAVAESSVSDSLHTSAVVQPVEHQGADHAVAAHAEGHGTAEASPVEAIMHHIADANEFHIATIGGEHISIPLPVIVYNKSNGQVSMGLSSDYHHEKDGLILSHENSRIVDAVSHKADNLIDFSITKNVFTMLLAAILLAVIFFSIKSAYSKNPGKAPKGIQSFFEPLVAYIIDEVAKPNLGSKYEKYLPYLLSVFFFILFCNLLGLIPFFPGSANASGNIAFTLTLSVLTFLMINLNGNKHYWQHVFAMPGVPKWVLIILTPVELLGLIIKPVALMLRLFANITAGHTIILSLVSLIFILGKNGDSVGGAVAGSGLAIPFVIFMNALELLVAFLQAFIFTLLSAIFIGMATEEHHEAHH